LRSGGIEEEAAGRRSASSLRQRGRLVGDGVSGGGDTGLGERAPAAPAALLAGRTLMRVERRRLVGSLGALGGTKCGMGEGRLASMAFSACSCAPFQ
jgi:hypothetical protein